MSAATVLAAMMPELDRLRAALGAGRATKGWLGNVGERAFMMEMTGVTHFGSDGKPRPDVLIHWLAEQVIHGRRDHLWVTGYLSRLSCERTGRTS